MSKELVAALNELASKVVEADDVVAGLAKARAELGSTKDLLESIRKELTDARTGLSAAQKKNAIAYDESIYAKNQELNEVKRKAVDAKQELDGVNAELKLARQSHDQVEASLTSLRQKFA